MIPVKVYPKFKCDFCKKKSTKFNMEKHEKICYYNPDRVCRDCSNEGIIHYPDSDYGEPSDKVCPCVEIVNLIKRVKDFKENNLI